MTFKLRETFRINTPDDANLKVLKNNLYSYVKNTNFQFDILGWEDIVYRALRPEDIVSIESGLGILPKDPSAKKGTGVASIDLDTIHNAKLDLSTAEGLRI